jgi:threonine aldolase
MLSLRNDYSEGAHPKVLAALMETNIEKTSGYSTDPYCERARQTIRGLTGAPDADVHFLVGGTNANLTIIASALRPFEAVVAASTGHIAVHETGAIEATGHKVVEMAAPEGKLTPALLHAASAVHSDEHMVLPKMAYISESTEVGTVYTKAELTALSLACKELGMFLFLDGARLSQALASEACDLTLPDLARLCDVFYIGGTKNGLLFGEAVVLCNDALKPGFRHMVKRQGGMLAKGRLLGIQFQALLEDGLYLEIARSANEKTQRIGQVLAAKGVVLLHEAETNMAFPVFSTAQIEYLLPLVAFELADRVSGDRQAIRLVTSWATTDADVDAFEHILEGLPK